MINFKTENEPTIKFFDFGVFKKIMKMLSHDEIIFHMLFGEFHDTPRNKVNGPSKNIYDKLDLKDHVTSNWESFREDAGISRN